MVRWQHALNAGLVLDAEHTRKAFTPYSLKNGEKLTYAYGWHLKDINGIRPGNTAEAFSDSSLWRCTFRPRISM